MTTDVPKDMRQLGISEARRLRVEPNDVLVLLCPHRLTDVAISRLNEQFEELFPGVKKIVLEGGMDMAAISMTELDISASG